MTDAIDGTATGTTLVCCGLLGTVAVDDGLLERSYAEAIATQGVVSGTSSFARRMAEVHQARGQAPADVLRQLFPENEARAQAAELAFERALSDGLHRVVMKPALGAVSVLTQLRESGHMVCIMTSLSRRALDAVLEATGLRALTDLTLGGEDAERGFPWPDLVLTALLRTRARAVSDVAVVHSTGAGVEAGRRSGAGVVAGVLSGPHAAARLRSAGATHILGSISDLPALLSGAPGEAIVAAQRGHRDADQAAGGLGGAQPELPHPGISLPAQVSMESRPLRR